MKLSFFSALMTAVFSCCSYAQLENGSFEANLDGWHASGFTPEVIASFTHNTSFSPNPATISAVDGSSFALLKSGGGSQENDYSEIWQDVTLIAGHTIKGVFFFATHDYLNWNDQAFIKLVPYDTTMHEILLAESSVAVVGNYGSMEGWGRFEYTFSNIEAGNYKLIANVHDELDTILSSYLAVDALTMTPEPASMVLLGLGAAAIRKRRRK